MRAVRVHAYGERPTVDEVPEPAVEGPTDVLVEIGAAGLCRTDLHIVEGQFAATSGVALPYTIGHENAGWVRAVGSAVSGVRPGDGVILHPIISCGHCRPCRAGDDAHCEHQRFPGLNCDGGMAGLLRTNARSVVRLEAGLQPVEVAALADAGLTAYHAVRRAVPLLYPGTAVVVIGVGGLGHIAVQCLVARTPARIIAVDTSAASLALAAELGAGHQVLADGTQVAQVRELTAGRGAHVVLDFVGERGAEADGLGMTRPAGSYFVVGYGGRVDVPTFKLTGEEISIVGNLVGSYTDLTELMTLTAEGKVRLRTRTYPLDRVNDAMDDLEAGRLHGRGILVPS